MINLCESRRGLAANEGDRLTGVGVCELTGQDSAHAGLHGRCEASAKNVVSSVTAIVVHVEPCCSEISRSFISGRVRVARQSLCLPKSQHAGYPDFDGSR